MSKFEEAVGNVLTEAREPNLRDAYYQLSDGIYSMKDFYDELEPKDLKALQDLEKAFEKFDKITGFGKTL